MPLPTSPAPRNRDTVQAIERAAKILKSFQRESEQLSLADLVERTGFSKTTTFRLAQTLAQVGLISRVGKGVYQSMIRPFPLRTLRIGFASQTDSEFSREVTASLHRAAARDHVRLVTVNNSYSPKKALLNAELLIREQVDLAIEFQTYERVAPIIASKFLEASIPVIALEIPHPGATYFGANNYQAGLIGGHALGKWAKENWRGEIDEILLLELPIAGALPQLRINGLLGGLRHELHNIDSLPIVHLDGKGGFERNFELVRRHLRLRKHRRTLVGAVNDMAALGALRAFEEAGAAHLCAVMGQNGIKEARMELRRPGSRLVGTVAYFPERYGEELIPLAVSMLEKKPLPDAIFAKHKLLTPQNVNLVYPLDS